jgi:hypothetical protein
MKKIIAFILCAVILCAMLIFAWATGITTAEIAAYIEHNFKEIVLIGVLILNIFFDIGKHGKLNGSIGTLNNNAIAVAENSANAIKVSSDEVKNASSEIKKYKDAVEELLDEIRKSDKEKKALESTIARVEMLLNTSKLAMIELANEVAELLVLANIPNSKKEEFYSRHRAAVNAIAIAESEVKSDEGTEA